MLGAIEADADAKRRGFIGARSDETLPLQLLFDRRAIAVPFDRRHRGRIIERGGLDRVARARCPAGDGIVKSGDFDRRHGRRTAAKRERRCGEQGDGKMMHHRAIMRHE